MKTTLDGMVADFTLVSSTSMFNCPGFQAGVRLGKWVGL